MTPATSAWASWSRGAAAAAFVATLGALPIAVELTGDTDPAAVAHAESVIAIATPIRISERLPLTIDGGLVSIKGRVATADDPGSSIVTIDEAVLTLNLAEVTTASLAPSLPDTKPPSVPQIAGFSSAALQFRDAAVTLIGPHGGRAHLDDVNATVTVNRKGKYTLAGHGYLNGQRLAVDAIWSEPAADSAGTAPLRVTLRGQALEAVLDGQFKPGPVPLFSGEAEFRLPSLRRFVGWAGLGHSIGDEFKSVVLAGSLEWSPSQMAFARARVSIDGNQATGALTVKHAGDRLSLDGTLGFQELDLGRYWAGPAGAVQEESERPHVLSMLDADLRLSAAKVRASEIELGRGAISIALNKGRLQADIAELEIEGGVAGGQVWVDVNEAAPKAGIRLTLRGFDAGRLLAEPMRRNPLLGRCNFVFEGTLGGDTLAEVVASLAGRGQFELAEPGRLGLDLAALIHAARASNVVGWAAAGKGGTALDSLAGRFRVINGALTIELLQARSGSGVFVGSGRLDVPARLIDMRIAAGPAGESPATPQDVLLLRGTWETPAISLMRPSAGPEAKIEAPLRAH